MLGGLMAGYTLMSGCMEKDYSDDFSASLDGTNAYYPTLGTVEDVDPITIASDTYGTLIPTNPEVFEKAERTVSGNEYF